MPLQYLSLYIKDVAIIGLSLVTVLCTFYLGRKNVRAISESKFRHDWIDTTRNDLSKFISLVTLFFNRVKILTWKIEEINNALQKAEQYHETLSLEQTKSEAYNDFLTHYVLEIETVYYDLQLLLNSHELEFKYVNSLIHQLYELTAIKVTDSKEILFEKLDTNQALSGEIIKKLITFMQELLIREWFDVKGDNRKIKRLRRKWRDFLKNVSS